MSVQVNPWPIARRGDDGEVVDFAREALGLLRGGGYDEVLAQRVRGFRLSRGLEPRDYLDEATLLMLGWRQ